jgi:diguanylate cyclase (GGDEF)-like protein
VDPHVGGPAAHPDLRAAPQRQDRHGREQEALRDPLTGLANRTLLASATDRALQQGSPTAMLLIDLDHFKDVNDTLGHAVGDELLLAVADRLREEVGEHDLVARLGGDEFVVLARGCDGAEAAVALASRIGEAIRQPYRVHGVVLTVGCSVGIGLAPDHVTSVVGLLRCADVALYSAKATRGTYALYDRRTDQHSAALLGLQADLRSAARAPVRHADLRRLPAPARPAHRPGQRGRVPRALEHPCSASSTPTASSRWPRAPRSSTCSCAACSTWR